MLYYGVGRLQQRTTRVFNQFQIYDNIAEKGCAGGLKPKDQNLMVISTVGKQFYLYLYPGMNINKIQ